ncbi:MAG: VOC family protein [Ignavibacteriae bacterium]|nr:VOC family protein [Ignavibacteriota bacterium]
MKFYAGETNIICSNLENSLKFYKDIIGFEEVEHDDGAIRMKFSGQYYLLLPVAKPVSERSEYCSVPEISLDILVDDMKEDIAHFELHKVKFIRPYKEGETWVIICDPDGLVIEVMEK